MIDTSGSICGSTLQGNLCNNWALLLSFVSDIIAHFDIGQYKTRVGVVTFSGDASLTFPLDLFHNVNELREAISSIKHVGGPTNTGKALHVARTQCFSRSTGEREGIPNIAIVITDGIPTVIEYDLFSESSELRQLARVLAVGVTPDAETRLLTEISSPTHNGNRHYFSSPNFPSLQNLKENVISTTCDIPTRVNKKRQKGKNFLVKVSCVYLNQLGGAVECFHNELLCRITMFQSS